MNQGVILLASAVLAAVSSLATCQIDDSYLNWARLPEAVLKSRSNTRMSLWKADIQSSDEPEDVYRKISNAYKPGTEEHTHEGIVYLNLKRMKEGDAACSRDMINVALEICSILRAYGDRFLDPFVKFLQEYGRKQFGQCSLEAEKILERSSRLNIGLLELDRFFAVSLGLNAGDDDRMLRELRSLDLAKSKFNFMLGLDDLARAVRVRRHVDNFYRFMKQSCYDLVATPRALHEEAMDIITLAEAFGYPPRKKPAKVLKMIEYHRLCLSLWREDTKDAVRERLEKESQLRRDEFCTIQ